MLVVINYRMEICEIRSCMLLFSSIERVDNSYFNIKLQINIPFIVPYRLSVRLSPYIIDVPCKYQSIVLMRSQRCMALSPCRPITSLVCLAGFECRCGGLYCSTHRYSDKHDCQFDYKKEGEDLIRKNNPVVVGAKLQKI